MASPTKHLSIIIGVVTLAMVLGSHVATAYIWLPITTPNYTTSIVSSVVYNVTWSPPIGATPSEPLLAFIPGNVYLGSYADGYYYASINFTVGIENPGTQPAPVTVYVSCPPPIGSGNASAIVPPNSTVNVTVTLRANINGPVASVNQTIECQLYTNLNTPNIILTSMEVPIEPQSYGFVCSHHFCDPAFEPIFRDPSFVCPPNDALCNSSITSTYGIFVVPFGGLTMNSEVCEISFSYGFWGCGSDTSQFQVVVPSGYEQLLFQIGLHPDYVLIPTIYPFTNVTAGLALEGSRPRVSYYDGFPGINITKTKIYVSPNGLTIIPIGAVYAIYTNATRWFTYTVQGIAGLNTQPANYTGIAVPLAPGETEAFWALVFMRDAAYYGSHLPVPILLMFNVTNIGYIMNKTLITRIINMNASSMPRGLNLSATFNVYGNYTIANVTLTTPIANITEDVLITEGYIYSPHNLTIPTYSAIIFPGEVANYYTGWVLDTGAPVDFPYYAFVSWFVMNVTVKKSPYLRQFSAVGLNGISALNFIIKPVVNMTVSNFTSSPVLSFGISLTALNLTMGRHHGIEIIMPNTVGDFISVLSTQYNGSYHPVSAYGFRKYVSRHMIQFFANVTGTTSLLLAYPWGYENVSIIDLYPNGAYSIVGHELVPILSPTRSINETLASYYVGTTTIQLSSGATVYTYAYVDDLIFTLDQTPQVAALYNGRFVPGVIIYTTGYNANMSRAPRVVTSDTSYVYMGYATPVDVPCAFGSTNQVYTTIYVTKYVLGTLYARYQSVPGPVEYEYTLPSVDDPVLNLELIKQPWVNVSSVDVSLTSVAINPGGTANLTVTVNLMGPAPTNETFNGTITLNETQVATFTITVPEGEGSASTTVTLKAPTTPSKYMGIVTISGKSASFTLTVTQATPALSTIAILIILLLVILAVVVYIIYRRRHG